MVGHRYPPPMFGSQALCPEPAVTPAAQALGRGPHPCPGSRPWEPPPSSAPRGQLTPSQPCTPSSSLLGLTRALLPWSSTDMSLAPPLPPVLYGRCSRPGCGPGCNAPLLRPGSNLPRPLPPTAQAGNVAQALMGLLFPLTGSRGLCHYSPSWHVHPSCPTSPLAPTTGLVPLVSSEMPLPRQPKGLPCPGPLPHSLPPAWPHAAPWPAPRLLHMVAPGRAYHPALGSCQSCPGPVSGAPGADPVPPALSPPHGPAAAELLASLCPDGCSHCPPVPLPGPAGRTLAVLGLLPVSS